MPTQCSAQGTFVFNSSLSGTHHQSIASLCRKNGNHPSGRFSQNMAGFKSEGSKKIYVYQKCVTIISFFFFFLFINVVSSYM
jgi:hypothetical protein